jgi:hypothetical protein
LRGDIMVALLLSFSGSTCPFISHRPSASRDQCVLLSQGSEPVRRNAVPSATSAPSESSPVRTTSWANHQDGGQDSVHHGDSDVECNVIADLLSSSVHLPAREPCRSSFFHANSQSSTSQRRTGPACQEPCVRVQSRRPALLRQEHAYRGSNGSLYPWLFQGGYRHCVCRSAKAATSLKYIRSTPKLGVQGVLCVKDLRVLQSSGAVPLVPRGTLAHTCVGGSFPQVARGNLELANRRVGTSNRGVKPRSSPPL